MKPQSSMPDHDHFGKLIRYGLPVFPCKPGGKKPLGRLVPRGMDDATTDPDVIRRWRAGARNANWAVRTGPLTEGSWAGEHLAVLDVDDPEVAQALLTRTQVAEFTATTRTPSGGLHVWALSKAPVFTSEVWAGDRRVGEIKATARSGGPGGYVLIRGATADGHYQFNWGSGPVRVPDGAAWFAELLRAVGLEARFGGRRPAAVRADAAGGPEPIPEGRRNTTLARLGGWLRAQGLDGEEIYRILSEINARRCDPPLADDEVRRIAYGLERYPPNSDGQPVNPQNFFSSPIELGRERKELSAWEPQPIGSPDDDPEPDWLWEGFIARGMLTDFYGLWKVGKSSLLGCLLRTMAAGGELAGRPVARGRALVISEEPKTKWSRRCRELGIPADAHDRITRPFKRQASWEEWDGFLGRVAALVQERGYALVIFDSLPNLWPVFRENEAGEVLRALRPLLAIAEAGAAVLLVRHPRKSDGPEATAGRGSGAVAGFVDIIVEFRRYQAEDPHDRRRVFTVYSREEPFELVAEFDGRTYVGLGDRGEVHRQERVAQLLDLLPPAPPGIELGEIRERWPSRPAPARNILDRDLKWLEAQGLVIRTGRGVKNNPLRFYRPGAPNGRPPPDSFFHARSYMERKEKSGAGAESVDYEELEL